MRRAVSLAMTIVYTSVAILFEVNGICLDNARIIPTTFGQPGSLRKRLGVAASSSLCRVYRGHCRFAPMSGLVSPRPISYNSYNPYARNVPQPYADSPASVGPGMGMHTPNQGVGAYPGTSPALPTVAHEEQKVYGLVIDLLNPEKREGALLELSKKREQYDDLALVLWHSFGESHLWTPYWLDWANNTIGIMPALLQEIVSVYPLLSPPNLTAHASNRVCNALALLQCVASHPETRQLFLNGACILLRSNIRVINMRQLIYHCFYTPFSTLRRRRVRLNTFG